MLKIDAEVTRILDNAYQGADLTRRRQASFDALLPNPRETIIDIGCGNGLLTAELARAVGPDGRVIGIDPSEAMRSAGEERCQDYSCVEFMDGLATALPLSDGVAEKAVSVQVFEYVDDIEGAVSDAMRCLHPEAVWLSATSISEASSGLATIQSGWRNWGPHGISISWLATYLHVCPAF